MWHAIIAIGQHTLLDDIGCDMPSLPFDSTHGGKMSGVSYHYSHCPAHTFIRCRAWHAIIALGNHTHNQTMSNMASIFTLGQHTLSHDVRDSMLLFPFDCTHGWTSLGLAMFSLPLGIIHDWTTSGIKVHHCPLVNKHGQTTSTWHAIMKFRLHKITASSSVACYHLSWGIRCNHCR